ncbi:MAG: hypothetical protein C4584_01400 [Armatimonadetes bacterium]|nr:MAG: hypothetical protein C4584_01400 [Armatimonadota bacterium]
MKSIKVLIILLSLALFFKTPAFADGISSCQTVYGGGIACPTNVSFTVNKMIQAPGKGGGLVNALSINDAKFAPGDTVSFQIEIKNTGSTKITGLKFVDSLPQFVTFVSGPGNFDQDSRTLTFSGSDLDVNKNQIFNLSVKIIDTKSLPQDQTIICIQNTVTATDSNNLSATDTTPFCIAKAVTTQPQVFPVTPLKETPPTGPEALSLLALIPGAIAGFFLKSKSLLQFNRGQKKN